MSEKNAEIRFDVLSDAELVRLSKDGNKSAFDFLMCKLQPLVKKSASVYDDGSFDFEDLVQEGSLACFNAIKSYDESKGASLNTFTAVCINNRLLNYIKKKTSRRIVASNEFIPFYDDELNPNNNAECTQPGAEDTFLASEKLRDIRDTMQKVLSPFEYRILCLYIEYENYEKIAAVTGQNVKSVDNALQRVRKKLKSIL